MNNTLTYLCAPVHREYARKFEDDVYRMLLQDRELFTRFIQREGSKLTTGSGDDSALQDSASFAYQFKNANIQKQIFLRGSLFARKYISLVGAPASQAFANGVYVRDDKISEYFCDFTCYPVYVKKGVVS